MFEHIHRSSIQHIEKNTADTLILGSATRRIGSRLFYTGCVLFIISMLTRGFMMNALGKIAVIPLALATLILVYSVWRFSAVARVVFSKQDGKVYRIYKHLGYLQKIYTTPLLSIDAAEVITSSNGHAVLQLCKDNHMYITLAEGRHDYTHIANAINAFIKD